MLPSVGRWRSQRVAWYDRREPGVVRSAVEASPEYPGLN
jgi:hypothetical protein